MSPWFKTFKETLTLESISEIVDYVQGQGIDSNLKRSVYEVREHFNSNRNAAIGRKMLLLRYFLASSYEEHKFHIIPIFEYPL